MIVFKQVGNNRTITIYMVLNVNLIIIIKNIDSSLYDFDIQWSF